MSRHVQESRSERGPVVNPRRVSLMAYVDPLNTGRSMKFAFELDIVDLVDTTTKAIVTYKGKTIEESSTHNDFYGIGTSRNEQIDAAKKMAERYDGEGFEIRVETTLMHAPVHFDGTKDPFYGGGVQVFALPSGVFLPGEGPPYKRIETKTETFVIWRNGHETEDHATLEARIAEAKAADVAGDRRKPWSR